MGPKYLPVLQIDGEHHDWVLDEYISNLKVCLQEICNYGNGTIFTYLLEKRAIQPVSRTAHYQSVGKSMRFRRVHSHLIILRRLKYLHGWTGTLITHAHTALTAASGESLMIISLMNTFQNRCVVPQVFVKKINTYFVD